MTIFFDDPNRPPTEDGVSENILTPTTMKRCQVLTTWTPIGGFDLDPPPTQQRTFMSSAAAAEWINSVTLDPRATGSPKQLAIKRASLLQTTPAILAQFAPTHTIQPLETADVHTPRTNPNAQANGRTSRPAAADPAPVSGGSLEDIFGGRNPLSAVLSDAEIEFLSHGSDPAEDGEED